MAGRKRKVPGNIIPSPWIDFSSDYEQQDQSTYGMRNASPPKKKSTHRDNVSLRIESIKSKHHL